MNPTEDHGINFIFKKLPDNPGELAYMLRPVYTSDFCCSNSMQFLSRQSYNFKISRVNHSAISARFSNLSPWYEIQLTKHDDFE